MTSPGTTTKQQSNTALVILFCGAIVGIYLAVALDARNRAIQFDKDALAIIRQAHTLNTVPQVKDESGNDSVSG